MTCYDPGVFMQWFMGNQNIDDGRLNVANEVIRWDSCDFLKLHAKSIKLCGETPYIKQGRPNLFPTR